MSINQIPDQDLASRLDQIENKLEDISTRDKSIQLPIDVRGLQRDDDEIDLRGLWIVVWQGKWIVIAITFIFSIASIIYSLSLPNIYRSETLLAPAEENSGGGLNGLAGQFGGLAGLAGVSLGGGSNKTSLAIEVLKSREFITKFIERNDLLVPLMAANGWDQGRNELKIDPNIYDVEEKKWARESGPTRDGKPSMQEAYKRFIQILSVEQEETPPFVRVGIEFYSPYLGKEWVDKIVGDINKEMKARDVAEANESIQYLSDQLEKTSIAELQTVFYELIEEQYKTVMFAAVREQYVFKTIDAPIVPELKARPKRALICVLGVMLGGALSIIYLLMRYFYFSPYDKAAVSE